MRFLCIRTPFFKFLELFSPKCYFFVTDVKIAYINNDKYSLLLRVWILKMLFFVKFWKKTPKSCENAVFDHFLACSGGFFQENPPKLIYTLIFWSYWAKKLSLNSIPFDDLFSHPINWGGLMLPSKTMFCFWRSLAIFVRIGNSGGFPVVSRQFPARTGAAAADCFLAASQFSPAPFNGFRIPSTIIKTSSGHLTDALWSRSAKNTDCCTWPLERILSAPNWWSFSTFTQL